jgi:hypothetical protein
VLRGETAELQYELACVYSIAYAQGPTQLRALKGGERPFLGDGVASELPTDRGLFPFYARGGPHSNAPADPDGSRKQRQARHQLAGMMPMKTIIRLRFTLFIFEWQISNA